MKMLRVFLFLPTNIAVLAVITLVFRLLGLESILQSNGVDLDLVALLIYAAVIGFSGSFNSLLLSKRMAKMALRVGIITQPANRTERWLIETLEAQSKAAGITPPEFGIFQSDAPNAFATGWNKNAALVAVSTGLLDHMEKGEVEAVLAHEVSHAANGDMVTLVLVQGVMNTFVVFMSRIAGFLVDRLIFRVERGHGPGNDGLGFCRP
ncbi:MAG: protease HtpX [Nitratireductor sp.]